MGDNRELIESRIKDTDFADWLCEREETFKFVVYRGMEAMDSDIESLDLSARAFNCLTRAGYDTINSLVEDIDSRIDFRKIRYMGRKGANEVMLKLFLYTYDNLKPEKRKAYLAKVKSLN